jgi:polyhydroxyalkanoate depolymerase
MAESKGMRRMSPMMYQTYQNTMDMTAPWRTAATALSYLKMLPSGFPTRSSARAAALELVSRSSLTYRRPDYDIKPVAVGNREWPVIEEVPFATPFGSLLHFKKEGAPEQPKVLLVAPMSGHFATLLRGTVQTLLQDHDVYITDWHNRATFRSIKANSASMNIPSISSHSWISSVRSRTWSRYVSPRCPRWPPAPSCRKTIIARDRRVPP